MESSQWFEAVVHPITHERTMLYADSQILLDGKIAAWHLAVDDVHPAEAVARRAVPAL